MANVVEGEPRNSQEWFGSYLTEDAIVADVLKRVSADAVAVKLWLDPVSWRVPNSWITRHPSLIFGRDRVAEPAQKDPEHAGSLMFAGMSIRNFYGLWHANNPHTAKDIHDELLIEDGIVTDPRHPDNLSGRIIDRVKAELQKLVPEAA